MSTSQIKDGVFLTSERIQNICRHDENSPFKEHHIYSDAIRKWIKDGKLIGEKQGTRWVVKKEDLEHFFEKGLKSV
ncbi:helix-turn-helix domain-containing protein [Robertmurraya sp. GLU-23]